MAPQFAEAATLLHVSTTEAWYRRMLDARDEAALNGSTPATDT